MFKLDKAKREAYQGPPSPPQPPVIHHKMFAEATTYGKERSLKAGATYPFIVAEASKDKRRCEEELSEQWFESRVANLKRLG